MISCLLLTQQVVMPGLGTIAVQPYHTEGAKLQHLAHESESSIFMSDNDDVDEVATQQ